MFFVPGTFDILVLGNTRRQRRINYLIMPITRSSDPHFTRNYLISMDEAQEITFDIFEILLNFCVFLIFLEILQMLKPLIGWDTALSKMKIRVLQRNSEPNKGNNSLIWHLFHSKWPRIDRGISGYHFWHFWNFAQFLSFSDFLGNSPNIEIPYWLRYSTFKVEDMHFTKELWTY